VIQTFSSPVVVCHHALPRDTADVLEFSKFTWNGHDYIQYVWDKWRADPDGILAVAEYGGRCVGMAKISLLAPGQWWLQGFRVDINYQDLKIGSHIHEYIDAWWLEHGAGYARLMTSSQRFKVHHLCDKLGYVRVSELTDHRALPLDEPTTTFQPIAQLEISKALEVAQSSPVLKLNHGLIDIGWEAIHPTAEILAETARAGMAFWWRGRESLLLAWVDEDEDGKVLGLALPACPLESLSELLADVRRLCAQLGCVRVFWIAPLHDDIRQAAEAAGYTGTWDSTAYVYEKRHPLSGTGSTQP
jgi:GNAT superfamily N-acetyltransferase